VFNYVPAPSFGRPRDDVTTQSSVPTSELSCRRFVQSTTRVSAHQTFNATRTNSIVQIPQDKRLTTFRYSFSSEQYRKPSGTSESSSRTFLDTLGALTNILGAFCTQTIRNTDLLCSLQHIIVNIAFVLPYVNQEFQPENHRTLQDWEHCDAPPCLSHCIV